MSEQWPEVLSMYWNVKWLQSESDVEIASKEIRIFFEDNAPTNAEMCGVIRWLASPACKQDRPPTLRELIKAVCIVRKNNRTMPDSPDKAKCAICNGFGWMTVYPDAPDNLTFQESVFKYRLSVPCLCSSGNRILNTVPIYAKATDSRRSILLSLANKGKRQLEAINSSVMSSGLAVQGNAKEDPGIAPQMAIWDELI